MKTQKEEYFSFYKNLDILNSIIYSLFLKLDFIKNLKTKENKSIKVFYSYNKNYIIKIFIYKKFCQFFIKIKTNNNYIKKIREFFLKNIENIKIIYSDFLINNNIDFYKKFIRYENQLRRVILKKMFITKGNSWWLDCVDKNISNICIKRSNFDKNKFHYIFYSDFLDIKSLILNNWTDLSFIFNDKKDNLSILNMINKKRNKIFHGRFDII